MSKLHGELIGPGVQGNIYKLNELDMHVYDVYDITAGRYYNSAERVQLCNELGLKHVPILYTMTMSGQTVDSRLTVKAY